jgi:hypothetical protein
MVLLVEAAVALTASLVQHRHCDNYTDGDFLLDGGDHLVVHVMIF